MNLTDWRNLLKWGWGALVLIFIGIFAVNKWEIISTSFTLLEWHHVVIAFLAIVFAKFCLAANMQLAAIRNGINLTFIESQRIYNFSQLAKYIPGSIWQFVSRAAMLHDRGHNPASIRDSIFAEHFWALGTAFIIGLVLSLVTAPNYLKSLIYSVEPAVYLFVYAIVLVSITVTVVLWFFKSKLKKIWYWAFQLFPSARALGVLALCWFALGFSLWITTIPFGEGNTSLAFVIGLYSLAYVIGFVVPFAPAGLGIREIILVGGLSLYMSADIAIVLAAANRVLYFLGEIILATLLWTKKVREKTFQQ